MTEYATGRSCHKMVAETAKALAQVAADDLLTRQNKLYARLREKYPDKTRDQITDLLAAKSWPMLIEQARATLAKMLNGPLDEGLKDQIAKALILDNTLMGRSRPGHKVH